MSTTDPVAEATARKAATAEAKKPATKRPATAKAPQDRKPAVTAKTEATEAEAKIVAGGREWIIDRVGVNNFELIDHINNVGKGGEVGLSAAPVVMRAWLGREQYAEAMDMLRDPETGIVTMKAGYEFTLELVMSDPNS